MIKETKCDHCGTACDTSITLDDKVFCCHGCKSVYTILWANGMESFYRRKDVEGAPVEMSDTYSFLDNEEIQKQVVDFSDGKVGVVRLFLPAIHCSACLWLLERLHKINEGVISVRVEFSKRTAHIRFREDVLSLRELAELLQAVGYPPHIRLSDGEDEEQKGSKDKRVIYQFGIAAFAFGNVMLMALPEYFYPGDHSLSEYAPFFRWLSLALVIPVLLYSARDYYSNAIRGIRLKRINVDQPIAVGVTALFLQSAWEIFSGTGSGYLDSLTGLLFFLLLGKIFQRKTYESLSFERDYKSYFPLGVTLINAEGAHEIVPVQNLEKGQRIYVRNEEIIPVDGMIISGTPVIDNAFVTGESTPEHKAVGDSVYAGGKQCGGAIEVLVERPMDKSYLTQLWNDQHFDGNKAERFHSLTDKVSRYFVLAILLLAVVTFSYWYLVADLATAIQVFTAVLIVACPCALALAAPFANGHALRLMGRFGLYLKRAEVVEALADINKIVWDKTGTLTDMARSRVDWMGAELTDKDKAAISGLMSSSKHPLSMRITAWLDTASEKVIQFSEITGMGVEGEVEENAWKVGSAVWLNQEETDDLNATHVHVMKNGEHFGYFRIQHAFRAEAANVVNALKPVYSQTVVTGDDEGEKRALIELFGDVVRLRFKQKPSDKHGAIVDLQKQGYRVAMIGDGLNDAGALNQSEVGISIAEDVNNFTPASDAILSAKSFAELPVFFRLAKYTRKVVYWSFALSFAYNLVGLSFAVSGMLSPLLSAILMPLSSITVVAFVSILVNRFPMEKKLENQSEKVQLKRRQASVEVG
ncbi:MAG: heavy metal translocating P-type ATPase metal-binding domain-containing protein [Flavobacteriia bacterium]|nr:heavy metal translocating P-type ATPase metal-binding domain-containing protein [Flavobacteriia bacterium]